MAEVKAITLQKRFMSSLKRGVQAKSMRVLKVRAIALHEISVDPVLLDYAVSEILYFKHNVTFPRFLAQLYKFYWQH